MIKIKKCKKLNCSEIKIYDSESELVKEYNKNLKQDPKQIKRSEKTDQEVRNILYIKSINEIYSKKIINNFDHRKIIEHIDIKIEILKRLVFIKHKNKELFKTTVSTLFRKINSLQLIDLIHLKNEFISI